jgi:tellurite resistance protein
MTTQSVNSRQTQIIVRGLHAIASCDGEIHVSEMQMIRQFYDSIAAEHDVPTFEALVAQPLNAKELREVLNTVEVQQYFLQFGILLARADNNYSRAEQDKIQEYAGMLGISAADLAHLEALVADKMMGALAHVKSTETLAEVAAGLEKRG